MEEYQILLLCLLAPICIAYFTVATIQKSAFIYLRFDEQGFYKQPVFILITTSSSLFFLIFSIIAWSGHSVNLNSDGLSNFLTLGILPIGILSGTIILLNLISRAHASHQTEIQISESKNNAVINNFNNHKTEFVNFINNYIDPEIVSKNNKLWISSSTHHRFYELDKSQILFRTNEYNRLTSSINNTLESFIFLINLNEEAKTTDEDHEIFKNLGAITDQLKFIRSYIANNEIFDFLSKPSIWYSITRVGFNGIESTSSREIPTYTMEELRQLFRIIYGYLIAIKTFEKESLSDIGVNEDFKFDIFLPCHNSERIDYIINSSLSKSIRVLKKKQTHLKPKQSKYPYRYF